MAERDPFADWDKMAALIGWAPNPEVEYWLDTWREKWEPVIREWRRNSEILTKMLALWGEHSKVEVPVDKKFLEDIREWREKAEKWDKSESGQGEQLLRQGIKAAIDEFWLPRAKAEAKMLFYKSRLEAVKNYLPKLLGKRGQATREWVRQHPDLSPTSVRDATLLEIHQELRAAVEGAAEEESPCR